MTTDKNPSVFKITKYILLLAALIFVSSCSKNDDKPVTEKQKQTVQNPDTQSDDQTSPADTNLTPEEKFSTSIMTDFLDELEDEDLQGFLEDEVFKYSNNYTGAAVISLTSSTWLLSLEKDNNVKNYIIQKYVDFKTNDYYFTMNETNLKIPDFSTHSGGKSGAGQ